MDFVKSKTKKGQKIQKGWEGVLLGEKLNSFKSQIAMRNMFIVALGMKVWKMMKNNLKSCTNINQLKKIYKRSRCQRHIYFRVLGTQ